MGTTTNERGAFEYRRPWFWLVVLGALAIAGTVAILVTSQSRLHAIDESFASNQMVRLQRVEHRIDDYFACANQLSMVASGLAGQTIGQERTVRWLLTRLFLSRRDKQVYGVGAFYAPYVFDHRTRLVSFYDHQPAPVDSSYVHKHSGFDEVVFRGARFPDDYPADSWYRTAVSRHGSVAYYGPYLEHGRSYVSVVQAFYRHGALAGVVAIDSLTPQFRTMLGSGAGDGDIVWVEGTDGRSLISTGSLPSQGSPYRDVSVALAYSHGIVHLTSDARPLVEAQQETVTAALIAIAVLWVLGICTAIGLTGRWRATQAAFALRAERGRLKDEIAVARRVESELRKAAFTDTLTGLPNRAAFLEAGTQILRGPRDTHAVFLVDLDRFNITNETLGHPAGDELLRILAARLTARVGAGGFLGRLGGDEFVMLLPCSAGHVYRMADMILRLIEGPAVLYGRTIYPQASIGIAVVDESYQSAEELLRDADIAMYAAKNRGRARSALFDTDMRRQVGLDAQLEEDLRRAILDGDIVAYYQPIVDLASGALSTFEALARWNRDGNVISAGEFVPFSEARGFVYQIDAAIQRAACSDATTILSLFPDSNIALNVSAPELTSPLFADQLRQFLRAFDVDPTHIRLEITETTMMTRADEAHKTLKTLAALGVSVVLDDFGTGYSSLSYLQRLPISGLKIDASFVTDIDTDERSREIVRSIVALARVLDLTTTAEGVEREAQVEALRALGVTYGQGFFFSPAIPVGRLCELGDGSIAV